ncbi:hypothetical protein EYF80_002461 [Liparis tanakae]|uniref:Uncharacterized protein n=1 Tax=Liparis tanakae TaxID=230148 RepID=A0A4Z2JAM0_9TELE|nr:hypothetical protein EYF80_002461 [Liparis tanakae]
MESTNVLNMTYVEETHKMYPVSRSGNNPGRVKRVVSCKRKTHHLTVTRRKQLGIGKIYDAANKENEMKRTQDVKQDTSDVDPWEFPLQFNNNPKTGTTGTEQADYCSLTEVIDSFLSQLT